MEKTLKYIWCTITTISINLLFLPIIELFCCAFDFLVLVIFMTITFPILSGTYFDITYILMNPANFYNVWGFSNAPYPLFIFRLFEYIQIYKIFDGFEKLFLLQKVNIDFFVSLFYLMYFIFYIFSYLTLTEYYFLKKFKRTPAMFIKGQMVVDDEGYDLTSRQIFYRNLIKYALIFSFPIYYPVIKYKKIRENYFHLDDEDCFIWDTMTETKVIYMKEHKNKLEEERINNFTRIQKMHIDQKNSFAEQYKDFIPDKINLTNVNENKAFINNYVDQSNENKIDLSNCYDIDEIITKKKSLQEKNFKNQYTKEIENTNILDHIDNNDIDFINKMKDLKKDTRTPKQILDDQFNEQYKKFINKD